jgi:hypothetical protein
MLTLVLSLTVTLYFLPLPTLFLPLPLFVLLLLCFPGAISVFTIPRLTIVFSNLRLPSYGMCGPISWADGVERLCFSGYADS